jgi:multiple sugar transport system permease protein
MAQFQITSPSPAPQPRQRFRLTMRKREALMGYVFLSPWILGFLIFLAGPMLASIYLSLTNYKMIQPPQWIGLANYEHHLLPALHHLRRGRRHRVRLDLQLPVRHPELSPIAGGDPGAELVGQPALGALGLCSDEPVGDRRQRGDFPGSPARSPPVLVRGCRDRWRRKLAAFLEDHPAHDLSSLLFVFIMGVIGTFQTFTQSYIMTGGGPANATLFYLLYLYKNAFNWFEMGYASALAWVLLAPSSRLLLWSENCSRLRWWLTALRGYASRGVGCCSSWFWPQ